MTNNLTVVITNFRRGDFLDRALKSVLVAGVAPANIVISSMEPDKRAKAVQQDARDCGAVVVSSETDLGCNELWLRGLYYAVNDYVLILHDDDYLSPEFGYKWETIMRPQLEAGVGFASWRGDISDGTSVSPTAYFSGPTRVCGSSSISAVNRRRGSCAISPVVSVFRRDDAIRVLKECAQNFTAPECFSRPGMMLGNEVLLYLRHAEKYASWLYVDEVLTTYGAHPESETIRHMTQGTSSVLVRGYDWARDYHHGHRGESFVPAARFLHVCSDYRPGDKQEFQRIENAKFSWDWQYEQGEAMPFLVSDDMLLRSSQSVLGDGRLIPFVRDLVDWGFKFAQPEDIILLTNRDVGITVNGIDKIRETFTAPLSAAFGWRRSFKPTPQRHYRNVMSGPRDGGVDLVAIRPQWWEQYRESMPDMLIGCEAWDWVLRVIVAASHVGRNVEIDGILYHEPHEGFWVKSENRRVNVGQKHNIRLAKNFFASRDWRHEARCVGH